MQSSFDKEWKRLLRTDILREQPVPDKPQLWRILGDEIIYVVDLRCRVDALIFLEAWLRAVQVERLKIADQYAGLDLKGAAWIAGFPVNNAQIVLLKEVSNDCELPDGDPVLINLLLLEQIASAPLRRDDIVVDYIGPSIDTGFRVAKEATPRKFMLTTDLAYLIAEAWCSLSEHDLQFRSQKFMYSGRVALKGVSDGEPYPLFWLDMADNSGFHQAEDGLLGRSAVEAVKVKEFCEHYLIDKRRSHVMRPYIYSGEASNPDGVIPERHLQRLQHLALYWTEECKKRKTEKDSMLSDTAPDADKGKQLRDEEVDRTVQDIHALIQQLSSQISKK